jgi:SAM-dependent methyltransferase
LTLDKRADTTYLRDIAYADPSGLTARISLYDHQQPKIDLVTEAIDVLAPVDGLTVADIGCGNGRYVTPLRAAGARVIGVDLSAGMLAGVPGPTNDLVAGDSQQLPLRDELVDVALMMHMLYHVPAPEMAIAEAARVVCPGGRLLLATNGGEHLAEMDALWLPLLSEAGIRGRLEDLGLVNTRLNADVAHTVLSRSFDAIEERAFRSSVVVTEPAPVVAHAASTTGARTVGDKREPLLSRFSAAIDERIALDGSFQITTEVVFFLCWVR